MFDHYIGTHSIHNSEQDSLTVLEVNRAAVLENQNKQQHNQQEKHQQLTTTQQGGKNSLEENEEEICTR